MKWNIVFGALVLSIGLSGQSFGAGLLNKMLGHGGCGCCDAAPSCGCDVAPSCGCEAASAGCDAAPSCGCEAAPSCGCEAAPLCGGCGCGHGLGGLFGKRPSCASPCCNLLKLNLPCLQGRGCGCAAPSCGCDAAPSCGCEAAPSCGCEAAPSCGCEAAPSCGCAAPSCGGGLFGKLKKCGNCCSLLKLNLPKMSGCGCGCSAAPSCGCAAGCDAGGDAGCTGEGQLDYGSPSQAPAADPGVAPEASDAAPMPPAPLVDPSAFVPSKCRVIAASAVSR